MKRSLGLLLFIVGLAGGWLANEATEFVQIDGCLDSGGAWDYQAKVCQKP